MQIVVQKKHTQIFFSFATFLKHESTGQPERGIQAEHPFATLKMRMGATHFLMKRLPQVATEMALHVLAYNLTRVMNIIGVQPLLAVMRA
jgi:hypothetical protein